MCPLMVLIKKSALRIKMNTPSALQAKMSDPPTILTRALIDKKIYDVFDAVLIDESCKVLLYGKKKGYPPLYMRPGYKYGIFPMHHTFPMHDIKPMSQFYVLNIGMKHLVGKIPNFNPKSVGDVLEMLRTIEKQPMCDIKECSIPVGQILGICGNLCRFHATMQPICCFEACMNEAKEGGVLCVCECELH
jgi:hypothetical protein